MTSLLIGDFLTRPKALGATHVGVWLGGGAVYHNAPDRGEHISSVADFAKGHRLRSFGQTPTLHSLSLVPAHGWRHRVAMMS